MIFVTVGTQLPFDRLVTTVDRWAEATGRGDVIAQIGRSSYAPRAIRTHQFMAPDQFARTQREADLLVAHCGIGSMLSALELGQPVVMMPRRHDLGEHRNDHQLATAKRLRDLPGVHIAEDEQELLHLLSAPDLPGPSGPMSDQAPQAFVNGLRSVLAELGQ